MGFSGESSSTFTSSLKVSETLVERLPTGEWWERAPAFEAVASNGAGVFDTLKAVSKLVVRAIG